MSVQTKPVIGIVSWDFAQPKGGLGRALQQIAAQVRASGRSVHVASPVSDADDDALLRITRTVGGHLLFSLLLPCVLRAWVRTRGVQTLLVPVGPGGVLLLVRPCVPTAAIVYHTYAQQARLVPGQWWKKICVPLERLTLRRCERVVCVCADTRDVLIHEYGMAEERIDYCTQAIDSAAWQTAEPPEQGLCVCVSRIDARKGVDVLLRAWPMVSASVPGARLVIVGQGSGAARADRSIQAIGPSVTRLPEVSFPQLVALVARAEVAICPSYLEGFGLACAEAMAAGTAVIASNTDGLRRLVQHNRTGLLVAPGDAQQLGRALRALLNHPALRMRLGKAAHAYVRTQHSVQQARHELLRAIDALERQSGVHGESDE